MTPAQNSNGTIIGQGLALRWRRRRRGMRAEATVPMGEF